MLNPVHVVVFVGAEVARRLVCPGLEHSISSTNEVCVCIDGNTEVIVDCPEVAIERSYITLDRQCLLFRSVSGLSRTVARRRTIHDRPFWSNLLVVFGKKREVKVDHSH